MREDLCSEAEARLLRRRVSDVIIIIIVILMIYQVNDITQRGIRGPEELETLQEARRGGSSDTNMGLLTNLYDAHTGWYNVIVHV